MNSVFIKLRTTVLLAYGKRGALGQIIEGPLIGFMALKTRLSLGIIMLEGILSPFLKDHLAYLL
jgi:hypothetical protein